MSQQEKVIVAYEKKIKQLKYQVRILERAAIEWMQKYDELKDKYEPERLTTADQALDALRNINKDETDPLFV